MRKKFMAGMLAATLAMGMNTAVFAEGDETPTCEDQSTATLTKIYTLDNEDTVSPAETFSFGELSCISVTDAAEGVTKDNAPKPGLGTVEYEKGDATTDGKEKAVTITLPEYTSVGIYTYTFTETAGNTAGVTYRSSEVKLVVTVVNDDDGLLRVAGVHTEGLLGGTKSDDFENTYSAGSLSVTKEVTGKLGDKDKEFNVTVTFYAPAYKSVKSEVTYELADGTVEPISMSDWEDGEATVKFKLSDGDTVKFKNIPYNVTYTVIEDDYSGDGYDTAKYTVVDGSGVEYKIDTESEGVLITNNKEGSVDTGINLDSMPYLMMMGVACAGMFTFFTKKRMARED